MAENRIVLLGESGVGKTCIISRFINDTFDPNVITSMGSQFVIKTIELPDGKSLTIHLWDTAGQEKYRSMNKIYYKRAKAAILVYDITDKKSFDEIKNYWYGQVKESGDKNIIFGLAANKSDLYDQRQVKDEEGEEFAKSIGAIFASTTAYDKYNDGIKILFENLAKKILEPDFDFYADESEKKIVKISTQIEKKKKCC